MERIIGPATNFNNPDTDLARTIAADNEWYVGAAGQILDENGIVVVEDIDAAALAMRSLGWFTPEDSYATGIVWAKLHGLSRIEVADAVRTASDLQS
jgi:hypothetical protein